MLEKLASLARRLRPITPVLMVVFGTLAAVAVVIVLNPGLSELQTALPLVVVGLLWTLCGLVFIQAFTTIPGPATPQMKGLERLVTLLNRGFHWLLALIFIGVSLAAVLLSNSLLRDALA